MKSLLLLVAVLPFALSGKGKGFKLLNLFVALFTGYLTARFFGDAKPIFDEKTLYIVLFLIGLIPSAISYMHMYSYVYGKNDWDHWDHHKGWDLLWYIICHACVPIVGSWCGAQYALDSLLVVNEAFPTRLALFFSASFVNFLPLGLLMLCACPL